MKQILIVLMMFIASFGWIAKTQAQDLTPFSFPANANPKILGKNYADDFASRTDYMLNGDVVHYAEIFAADAAINFAHSTNDEALFGQLQEKYEPFFDDNWDLNPMTFVSSMPMLAFYSHAGKARYLDRAYDFARGPRPYRPDADKLANLVADGMFFVPTINSRFYELDGNTGWTEWTADCQSIHLDYLLLPNGLIKHTVKFGDTYFVWGRGMGWASGGLANCLQSIPEDHPERAYLMESYLKMMEGLIPYQTENGLWYQLVDKPASFIEDGVTLYNWEETSCTGLFAYAMLTGIRMGWLDQATYGPIVEKAWLGLVGMLNEDGELTNTCVPTVAHDTAFDYLKSRRAATGDYHAQAAFLMIAEAITIFNNVASSGSNLEVLITSPANGAIISPSEDVVVNATASGNDSGLDYVVLWLYDGTWHNKDTLTEAPFNWNLGQLAPDNYTIKATAFAKDSAQISHTIDITVSDLETGVVSNDMEQVDFKMYPNPAYHENVTIAIENMDSFTKVSLYDVNGKAISHYTKGKSNFEISINDITSGIYFVKLTNQYTTITKKLIIR